MSKFNINYKSGLIICHAKIEAKRTPIFLKLALDTGATKTIIPGEAALSIGIDPTHTTKKTEITTGSGTVICPIIKIPIFSCLGISIKNFEVVCHTLPSESPVEGLLGLNFLLNANKLILNFSQNTLEIL